MFSSLTQLTHACVRTSVVVFAWLLHHEIFCIATFFMPPSRALCIFMSAKLSLVHCCFLSSPLSLSFLSLYIFLQLDGSNLERAIANIVRQTMIFFLSFPMPNSVWLNDEGKIHLRDCAELRKAKKDWYLFGWPNQVVALKKKEPPRMNWSESTRNSLKCR